MKKSKHSYKHRNLEKESMQVGMYINACRRKRKKTNTKHQSSTMGGDNFNLGSCELDY